MALDHFTVIKGRTQSAVLSRNKSESDRNSSRNEKERRSGPLV